MNPFQTELFVLFCFLFLMEISSRTPVPFLKPGSVHSSSANLGDCGRAFPNELRMSSFPSHTRPMPGQHGQTNPASLCRGCIHV